MSLSMLSYFNERGQGRTKSLTKIAKLEEDHETEIAKLKQNHETEITKLEEAIAKLEGGSTTRK